MDNNTVNQKVEEFVTEISMSTNNKPWLILEGRSDEKFFQSRRFSLQPNLIAVWGWENVFEVVQLINQESIRKVLGVVDRDYREELGIKMPCKNIAVTDYKDLEVMMFHSQALPKVITEFASKEKLPKTENDDPDYEEIKKILVIMLFK